MQVDQKLMLDLKVMLAQTIQNLENEIAQLRLNSQQQLATKDDMIKSLQGAVSQSETRNSFTDVDV